MMPFGMLSSVADPDLDTEPELDHWGSINDFSSSGSMDPNFLWKLFKPRMSAPLKENYINMWGERGSVAPCQAYSCLV